MAGARGDLVAEGQRQLEAAQWTAARDLFAAALEDAEDPRALDGFGMAAWFLADIAGGIAARERAFDGYVREGRCDQAARLATWVSHQHSLGGRASAARGWLARAERALEGVGSCVGHGWVAVERARHATSLGDCIEHAQRALAVGRRFEDPDLEVFALSVLGRAVVQAGRHQEGIDLLEEAMAAASAGRVRNVHTLAEAYCNLVMACTSAGDWERAHEWCERVDAFAQEKGLFPLFGACRTVHADVLVAAGRWEEAETALETALEAHERYIPQMGAPTVASLAELRVRQGRLAEATELLAGREEHPSSLRALASLRLAEGRPEVAVALLERGLLGVEDDAVHATQLLAPLVDARLAAGDLEGAQRTAGDLAAMARRSQTRNAGARADLAAARVALATGRPDDAVEPASRALSSFLTMAMPFEAGEARLELARALLHRSPDLAAEEARSALAAFRELGAARAMDLAASVLRELGSGTAARPRSAGELTQREGEVLELLTRGMSNAQIAQALFISEKTAGHHVSRILAKMGVRNRAEAAAVAVRAAAPR